MTPDRMDTDVVTQVLNASSLQVGGDDYAVKNSDRKSFVSKIHTRIAFDRRDGIDSTDVRYRFMALSDAIVQSSASGDSDAVFITTTDGKRIDPQSSPTNADEFQDYIHWTSFAAGRQTSASATIIVHSDVRYNQVKSRIFRFLEANSIFLKPNFSETSLEEIVRVAIIPFMHPDITFRKGLAEALKAKLHAVLQIKTDEFKSRYPCLSTADFKFDVIVSKTREQVEFQRASVSTSILLVECPKSQSLLVRTILQEALTLMSPTDDGLPNYSCIPTVLKNASKFPKGPAMVFHLLKKHQAFLDNCQSFQIKGVHRATMDILKTKILSACPAITAIEPSFMANDFGKWFLCSTSARLKEAQTWIDDNLQSLMDGLSPEDKPSLPKAVLPQRIIDYGSVPDSQMDNLFTLSGMSISDPTVNAWSTPTTLTAPTMQNTSSTLSASQATMISDLITKVQALESLLDSQTSTPVQPTLDPTPIPAQISDFISDQVLEHTTNLQHSLDASLLHLRSDYTHQAQKINSIDFKLAAQDTTISNIQERIDDFESNISYQVAPLKEAIDAGGLAALIQKTVLGCLTQTQHPPPSVPQPMEEDFNTYVQTPRRTFNHAASGIASPPSANKRSIPPSPFSRNGQSSPLRVRRRNASLSPPSFSPTKTD